MGVPTSQMNSTVSNTANRHGRSKSVKKRNRLLTKKRPRNSQIGCHEASFLRFRGKIACNFWGEYALQRRRKKVAGEEFEPEISFDFSRSHQKCSGGSLNNLLLRYQLAFCSCSACIRLSSLSIFRKSTVIMIPIPNSAGTQPSMALMALIAESGCTARSAL